MKSPWAKFYFSDWRSDPRLRMCSLAARGLWIEMLCLMHEAEPYGHLTVNGRAPTDAQLAVLTGAPLEQIPDLLGELESTGVFSRTQKGVIYSRRMTRDAKKAQIARQNGKSGGNPKLCNKGENHTSDNLPDKPTDKVTDKTHMPDAICQKENNKCSFSEFWHEWPDKSSGRKVAETAYLKAIKRGADHAEIMAGLDAYIAGKPTWKNWSHATTWLNQDRWTVRFDAQPAPSLFDPEESKWGARLETLRSRGEWDGKWGPRPGEPNCQVPPRLLERIAA